jgi:integrase
MLSVLTRHHEACPHRDNAGWKRCSCPKHIHGTLPGRPGRFRISAKTKSWEQAQQLLRRYEHAAIGGQEIEPVRKAPTVREAVTAYLDDAKARGLAGSTLNKLALIFEKRLLDYCEANDLIFLRDLNAQNLTKWRSTWTDEALSNKKKFERVVGFFWFSVRQGWIQDNPASAMGRVIARQTPTDYFPRDEYARILGATYRLDEYDDRTYDVEKRGARIRALTELMRWSGLRIRDAVTLERMRLNGNKLLLYQAKTGVPVFVPLPPHVADLLRNMPEGLKPNPRYFFWSGNGQPKTFVANWQRSYRRLFKVANICGADGTPKRCHPHMFRDTFAVEMLLAGVPIDQVSILLGHASVKVTEKHYSPWVRARQDQLEASVKQAWRDPEPEPHLRANSSSRNRRGMKAVKLARDRKNISGLSSADKN